jgi:hypothetical protein
LTAAWREFSAPEILECVEVTTALKFPPRQISLAQNGDFNAPA